ncbi:MAG: NUDIX hydrolase [Candidatus Micrarchaeota archaeon]
MKVWKAVKAVIRNSEGRILFIKEKSRSRNFSYYGIPGGRLNPRESEEEGLKREVWEETGLKVKVGRFLGEFQFTMGNGEKVEAKAFECEVENSIGDLTHAFQDAVQEDIEGVGWFTPEEFLSKKLPDIGGNFLAFLKTLSEE